MEEPELAGTGEDVKVTLKNSQGEEVSERSHYNNHTEEKEEEPAG